MPGLLDPNDDGLISPEEQKQIAMQNLFSGLLQGGLQMVAAGENLQPWQRAQMLGQVAQTFGGMPQNMQQAMQSAAQQKLMAQRVAKDKRDEAADAELAKVGENPDFLNTLKQMPPDLQATIPALIRARRTGDAVRLMDNWRSSEVEREKLKAKSEGAFAGQGMDQQAYNIIIRAAKDPSLAQTPEYIAAYTHLTKPRTIYDPTRGVEIAQPPVDLSWAPRPASYGSAPAGQEAPNQQAPQPGQQSVTVPVGGATARPVANLPQKPPPESFKNLESEIRSTAAAINQFEDVITKAGGGSFRAYINDPNSPEAQKVLGAFSALKMALRSPAFMNTGVLQPAEMKMLEDDLLSPQSIRGYFASPDAYKAKLNEIRTFMDGKIKGAYDAHQIPLPDGLRFSKAKKPPVPGAREADDGNWYVEQNGKYYRVDQ